MNNSKLLETVKGFTADEIQRLTLFLHSPYFQKDGITEDEVRLFDYLKDCYPDFLPEKVAKAAIFEELYPGSAPVKGKLEKKMSALLTHIQRFIVLEHWEKKEDPVRKLIYLSHFYKEREVDRLYKITLGHVQKSQRTKKRKDMTYFFNEFLVESEIVAYQSLNNTRKENLNLPSSLKSLEIFYLAKKLEYLCGQLSPIKSQIPTEVQEELKDLMDKKGSLEAAGYLDIPLIKVYFKAFLFLQDQDDIQAYTELRNLLREHEEELSREDLKALKAICRNFTVYQFNQGNESYLAETFRLYQEDLKDGFLYYNDGLIPSTIRNLVSIGLSQEQYEWVYQLLEDHKDRIVGSKYPNDVYHFNLANYYFELKDYDNALKYLADHYDDLYYQIAARRLEIKVHYEEDTTLLDPKLDAFKVFIYRLSKEKLPDLPRRGNKNFYNALRQIINPITDFDDKRIDRLIKKIKGQNIIVEKDWILEKLYRLKGK